VYPYVAFLALWQAPAQPASVPLTDDCGESASILAQLPVNAKVEVRSALAGYSTSCYAVTAVVDGKSVRGYVQGSGLEAVAEFEKERAVRDAALVGPPPAAAPAEPAAAAKVPAAPVEKLHGPPFPVFSGTDMKHKPVSVRSLKGKIILVCFWAPNNAPSSRELLLVNRLFSQFQKQGVDALAVTLSGDNPQLRDTVDDYHLGFRNLPNGSDIAARLNIGYESIPRTYVLNEDFEVIASGLHNKALEDFVKKLAAEQK
jgi:peroxiredoxin